MRVLVADDDRVVRRGLRAALQHLGHDVLEAEDGEEAWALYQDKDARLVILDWMMPKLDGLAVSRLIRSENRVKYTYVIMLTSLTGKGPFLEGMRAGVDDFATKPIGVDELAARVRVAERVVGLQAEVRQLEGLLSICSYCKRMRDDSGKWEDLETAIRNQSGTAFSQSVCPECASTLDSSGQSVTSGAGS